jgi:hypothetical protein
MFIFIKPNNPFIMKRSLVFATLLVFVTSFSAIAAEKPDSLKLWKKGGDISLTFSQVSLNNWSAGGKNSISGTFLTNLYANYAKNKNAWDNSLSFGYGMMKQGSDNAIKTEDRILLTSKYGYSAGGNWFYSGLMDIRTQMTTGYQDPPENTRVISELMAPAYLLFSLGMDYKPNDEFSLYISPVTSKMTFVLDDNLSNEGAYGVEPGDNMRGEFGASVKSVFQKKEILKNVDLFTRLDLFSNLAEDPQHIDVDWEGRLNFKLNSYLTAVFALNILYDHDIKHIEYVGEERIIRGARMQTKQLIRFGLNFKF